MALPNNTNTSELCKKCSKHMPPIREDVYLKHRGYHKNCWKDMKDIQDNLLARIGALTDAQQVEIMKDFKKTYNLAKLL